MAEWADVYKNIQPADPLKQIGGVYGVLNADQQLKLARQAEQVRQYDLMQNQATDLLNTAGTLANVPGVTNVDVQAHMAQRARQLGINPRVYELAKQKFDGLSGSALTKELQIHGARAAGVPGITARDQTIEPSTGAASSVPAPALIGRAAPTGLGPAAQAAAATAGGAAGTGAAQARDNSLRYQEQTFPLEQAINALETLGTKGTGPGTETLNHIKSFALSMGVPGVDEKGVMTFDKAKKYLTDYVNQNGNNATNDKLAASFAGNPSVNISNAAAVDVAKSAVALRRLSEARTRAFEASGLPDSEFAKFAGKWAREHDVRVYGFDMMTPGQRKKVLEGMPEAKRNLFLLDVQEAKNSGLLRAPHHAAKG